MDLDSDVALAFCRVQGERNGIALDTRCNRKAWWSQVPHPNIGHAFSSTE